MALYLDNSEHKLMTLQQLNQNTMLDCETFQASWKVFSGAFSGGLANVQVEIIISNLTEKFAMNSCTI